MDDAGRTAFRGNAYWESMNPDVADYRRPGENGAGRVTRLVTGR